MTWLDWALSAGFAALVYVVFVQRLNPGAPDRDHAWVAAARNADPDELLLITGQMQAERPAGRSAAP